MKFHTCCSSSAADTLPRGGVTVPLLPVSSSCLQPPGTKVQIFRNRKKSNIWLKNDQRIELSLCTTRPAKQ